MDAIFESCKIKTRSPKLWIRVQFFLQRIKLVNMPITMHAAVDIITNCHQEIPIGLDQVKDALIVLHRPRKEAGRDIVGNGLVTAAAECCHE